VYESNTKIKIINNFLVIFLKIKYSKAKNSEVSWALAPLLDKLNGRLVAKRTN